MLANTEDTTYSGFTLTTADEQALANRHQLFCLTAGDKLKISLIVDFPNYVANPLSHLRKHSALESFGLVPVDGSLRHDGGRPRLAS